MKVNVILKNTHFKYPKLDWIHEKETLNFRKIFDFVIYIFKFKQTWRSRSTHSFYFHSIESFCLFLLLSRYFELMLGWENIYNLLWFEHAKTDSLHQHFDYHQKYRIFSRNSKFISFTRLSWMNHSECRVKKLQKVYLYFMAKRQIFVFPVFFCCFLEWKL